MSVYIQGAFVTPSSTRQAQLMREVRPNGRPFAGHDAVDAGVAQGLGRASPGPQSLRAGPGPQRRAGCDYASWPGLGPPLRRWCRWPGENSILRRLFERAKLKARSVAGSGFVGLAWKQRYFFVGGKSVQLPCATSAAMPVALNSPGRFFWCSCRVFSRKSAFIPIRQSLCRPYDRHRLAWVRGFCGPLDGLNFHF